jgi:hypothetical protein
MPNPTASSQLTSPAGRKRRWGLAGAACGCAGLLGAACLTLGALGWIGYDVQRSTPRILEGIEVNSEAPPEYGLTAEQQETLTALGPPQSFSILFYQDTMEDGSVYDVRMETWTYFDAQTEITFVDGSRVAQDPVVIEGATVQPVPYRPEQFTGEMTLAQVLAAANLDTYLIVPLEKELLPQGEVYYADQLTFGLKDGELRYVESLPQAEEG